MKILRRAIIALASVVAVALLVVTGAVLLAVQREKNAVGQLGPPAPTVEVDGLHLRDLNKNRRIDPYEDFRVDVDERVDDLLGRMTVAEKVGLLMWPPVFMEKSGRLVDAWGGVFAQGFGTREAISARGIVHFDLQNPSTCHATAKWHNRLQRLAERTRLGIPVLVSSAPRHGTQGALRSPPGQSPSFSDWPTPPGLAAMGDEDLATRLGEIARQQYRAVGIRATTLPRPAPWNEKVQGAYVEGFRGGSSVGHESVLLLEPHASAEAAELHTAVSAGGILLEAGRLTHLAAGATGTAERYAQALGGGADRFEGDLGRDPQPLIELVRSGAVAPEQIDAAVRRVLGDQFRLGLFDDPYVDPNVAADLCDRRAFREAALEAQHRSIVLLQNDEQMDGGTILPLKRKARIYVAGIDPSAAAHYAVVVPTLEEADAALIRLGGAHPSDRENLRTIAQTKPTIVAIEVESPTDASDLAAHTAALLVDFGVGDEALLDVVFGRFPPSGRLPFSLGPPDSDGSSPERFPSGFGLSYPR